MFAPKNILVPTDFSEHSDEALKEAVDLAHQYHSRVYLLHVAEPITQCAGDYCLDAAAMLQAEEDARSAAQEKLEKEIAQFSDDRDLEIISEIRKGDPAQEILKEQRERGVDLIIMPSHRKTGLLKRIMGPVTEKVMEEAKSPVLLVRH